MVDGTLGCYTVNTGNLLAKKFPCSFNNAAENVHKPPGNTPNCVQNKSTRTDGCFSIVQVAVKAQGKVRYVLHAHVKVAVQRLAVKVNPAAAGNLKVRAFEIKITTPRHAIGNTA